MDAEISQDFSDILETVDFFLEGRFEAWNGKWGVMLDPTIGFLSDEARVGPLKLDVETNLALVGFGVNRTLYAGPRSSGSPFNTRIEAGLGGVFVRVRSEIDLPSPLPDPEFKESFVDAAITLRSTTEINDLWLARVGGLAGGFGIGESSELSLVFEALLGRRIGENKRLWFGYRVMSLDIERGGGPSKVDLDVLLHGPVIGLSYRF